mmetsp:Transcript_9985/g.19172  ORF Transcript_9985/g.19172 Transcript_9985/m.19172 type:complete len:83 (+) Transcript_9985:459-707(+)
MSLKRGCLQLAQVVCLIGVSIDEDVLLIPLDTKPLCLCSRMESQSYPLERSLEVAHEWGLVVDVVDAFDVVDVVAVLNVVDR